MLGKAWAGLCALQLGRQLQPSAPRLESIQEGTGRKEETAENREGLTGIGGEINYLLPIAFWMYLSVSQIIDPLGMICNLHPWRLRVVFCPGQCYVTLNQLLTSLCLCSLIK